MTDASLRDKERAQEQIWRRTTWIYRAILGLLMIASVAAVVSAYQTKGAVAELQTQVQQSREDRIRYQTDQRELGCEVLGKLQGQSSVCPLPQAPSQ